MDAFYVNQVRRLLDRGVLRRDMRVLVVCGGKLDRDVLQSLGFTDVVISDVSAPLEGADGMDFEYAKENAEALSFADASFDWVLVHYGLHHCRQPHKALCDMYRVARRGILMFEPQENLLVRAGRWLKVGQEYEVHAVAANELVAGGMDNSAIPNLVYRWTVREVVDTLRAYDPEHPLSHEAHYHLEIHWADLKAKRAWGPLWLARLAWPLLRLLQHACPSLANVVAVAVMKSDSVHPWLTKSESGDIVANPIWFDRHIPKEDSNSMARDRIESAE